MNASLLEAFAAFHWSEQVAVIAGLIYVILAARESHWCFWWGILGCALWAYASFSLYNLYFDALLQLFYVGMSVLGLYRWKWGQASPKDELPITSMSLQQHLTIITICVGLALPFSYFFATYPQAAATLPDALTTIFSIAATFLFINKKMENWLYWVVTDMTYIWLYQSRGATLFALLMVLYTVIAAVAYWQWRQKLQLYAVKA